MSKCKGSPRTKPILKIPPSKSYATRPDGVKAYIELFDIMNKLKPNQTVLLKDLK